MGSDVRARSGEHPLDSNAQIDGKAEAETKAKPYLLQHKMPTKDRPSDPDLGLDFEPSELTPN